MHTRIRHCAIALTAVGVLTACSGGSTTEAPGDTPRGASTAPAPDVAALEPISVGSLEPGAYGTDFLGTPLGIMLNEPWSVPLANPGAVVLEDVDRAAPFTRAVLLLRGYTFLVPGTLDPSDLDGFLEILDTHVVHDRGESTVSGHPAVWVDLSVTSTEEPFVEAAGIGTIVLRNAETARVWIVDQGDQPPLLIFAPVTNDDVAWLDTADDVVSSISLGVPAPPPVDALESEPMMDGVDAQGFFNSERFPLGLLAFDLHMDAQVAEPFPGLVVAELPEGQHPGQAPAVVFIAVTQTADGVPLPDRAAFEAEILSRGGSIEAVESVTIMGQEVTGMTTQGDVLGPISVAPVGDDPESLPLLTASPHGVDFLVDTPNGLLLVSASAQDEAELNVALDLLRIMATSIGLD